MKEKGDSCILVGYSTQSKRYRVYNKRTRLIVESIHIKFNEIKELSKASDYDNFGPVPPLQKTSDHNHLELDIQDHKNEPSSSTLVPIVSPPANTDAPSLQELDLLFSPLYDELFSAEPITPTTTVHAEENTDNQAEDAHFEPYAFINPFCTSVQEVTESSSRNVDNSNMHTFYQRHQSEHRWTKDHPLEQVQGNPSKSVQTRRQLATDPEICMFALTMSTAEPSNIKEAMVDHTWIEAIRSLGSRGGLCCQPYGFVDPDHPEKVYRLRKALYGLKQAPKAWYDELSNFLMSKGFTKGIIDPTLFMIRYGEDILLVQIYADDIIFGSTNPKFSLRFEKLMHSRFEMSLIGQMKFFLRHQIHQSLRGIFINQAKYALEILKKHGMDKCDSIGTPMATKPKLDADFSGTLVDQTRYRSMIESLIYLTSSRPDLVQAGTINMGLYTYGGIPFLGEKLVSWMSKKQDCTAMSLAEAEYVSLSVSSIAISYNPVQHSRTKHINVRYHFSKEQVERGIIELYFVRIEYQLADMFTKALPKERFQYLVRRIGMRCLTLAELEVLANESA
ncbi:retrovirus-related pol polyprotein from transposon TNT 1-94 [Tanacetum coccineum]